MNGAIPEMVHCSNIPGNVSGNRPDMTVLGRQRTRMKWQEPGQDQSYYYGSEFGVSNEGNQVQNFQEIKPDPGLENGWPDRGIDVFGACGYGNASACELSSAFFRTASCPPAVAAGEAEAAAAKRNSLVLSEKISTESFKKRKAEKLLKTKVVDEDESKDKKLKGCAEDGDSKITEQTSGDTSKDNSKSSVVQTTDYIHVRARRGQATDSHSLAERVRREKISVKMKYLQDLVPGCNKITGKAGMLDEIINYVQSLQRQVEFLSMKLANVNPTLDFGIDNLFAREAYPSCSTSFPTNGMSMEMTNPAYLQFDSSSFAQIQPSSVWDADLQKNCNVEFNPERSSAFPSQQFTGLEYRRSQSQSQSTKFRGTQMIVADIIEACSLIMEM